MATDRAAATISEARSFMATGCHAIGRSTSFRPPSAYFGNLLGNFIQLPGRPTYKPSVTKERCPCEQAAAV
jgi:hypothetical protein